MPSSHEFVPDYIKEGRKKHYNSMVQSHRGGEISKEYLEANPHQVKGMIKEGVVTEDQVKKAKYVWKDQPAWHTRDRSK